MGAKLVKAARNGQLQEVRELVEKHGVDVNEVNITSQTALYAAATNNHVEIVRYLLDHKADINARDLGTRTPLMDSAFYGQAAALELLLQRGADTELVDMDGRTALIIAAKCGFVQCVRSLLDHGADFAIKDKKYNKTALDYASENDHREICGLLGTKARDAAAALSLIQASREGSQQEVDRLLQTIAGGNVDTPDENNWTPLLWAASQGHVDIVRTLLAHAANVNWVSRHNSTALMLAAYQGHSQVVDLLLAYHSPMDLVDKDGDTALMCAAHAGHIQIVQKLIQCGAETSVTNVKGQSATDYASQNGYPAIVRLVENSRIIPASAALLIQASRAGQHADVDRLVQTAGVNVNIVGENNWTPLIWAARQGHSNIARSLLAHGAIVNWLGVHGSSALMFAAEEGHVQVVNVLLENHAAIDLIDKDGNTALMRAAWGGHFQIVKSLAQHGARTDVKNLQGLTAMDYASMNGQVDIVQYLERVLADQYGVALLKAAGEGQQAIVIELLQIPGIDVNMVDSRGLTPLMNAAKKKRTDIVTALLKHSVDMNVADQDGDTALLLAVRNNNADITQKLLLAGADAHTTNKLGYTALLISTGYGNINMVLDLLQKQVNVDASDLLEGYTALMSAAYFGFVDIVHILLEHCANENLVSRNGKTALLLAAEGAHVSIMRVLLKHDAIVDMTDSKGDTPLIIAVKKNNTEMVRMLLASNADTSSKDSEGKTAQSIASEKNLHTIVQLLLDFEAVKASQHLLKSAKEDHLQDIDQLLNFPAINLELTGEDGKNPLMLASEHGDVYAVQALLSHRGDRDVNKVDLDGNSALMLAAKHGHVNVARILLEYDASVNLVNIHGKNALLLSATGEHTDVMLFLLEKEVDINIVDANGESALVHVAKSGQEEVARKLLQSGAVIDLYNNDKKNAFTVATEYGHDEIAQLFLNHARSQQALLASHNLVQAARDGRLLEVEAALETPGINIDAADENAYTPLMLASQRGDEEVVKLLLAYNASINSVQDVGRSALMLAVEKGFIGVVCLLLANGADVNVVDKAGDSALTIGVKNSHVEIIRKLVNFENQKKAEVRADTRNDTVRLASTERARVPKALSLRSMEEIHLQCGRMSEAEKMCAGIYARFEDLTIEVTGKPQVNALLSKMLLGFDDFLTKYGGKRLITRLVSNRVIIDMCETFHIKLDGLLRRYQLNAGSTGVHTWKTQFKIDADSQRKFFKDVLIMRKDTLIVECQDPAAQKEALTLLLFESSQRKAKYSADALELIKRITTYVAGFSRLGIPSLPKWFIPPHEVEYEMRPFAGGAYGSVHRGTWEGTGVAVKLAFEDEESRALFLEEADIWTELHHPHLVKLYGACHVGNLFFVCEFASNGTLVEYLDDENHSHVVWKRLYEAALGLQHMHTKKRMVHRDLKCNNILVGADEKAKISDFGLSCLETNLANTGIMTEVGAIAWKAPECIAGDSSGSFAADIYSFGMCILEAVTRDRPWGIMEDVTIKYKVLTRRELPKRPSSFTDAQWHFIEEMCCFDPSNRINISAVVKQLQEFAEQEEDDFMAKDWADYEQQYPQDN